jgi:hypothetical protein
MSNPVIVAELKRIAAEHDGELRPSDVVEAARPKNSALHSKFEWDNTEAAERYRLWQARQLISVTVEYIGSGKEAMITRVFVSLTSDRKEDGAGYRATVDVMADAGQRKQLMADAAKDMERFQEKYADLKELAQVFSAMRKVSAGHGKARHGQERPAVARI